MRRKKSSTERGDLKELLRSLYQLNTYWNSKMILYNVDLFMCEAFDDYFVAQTLGFFIGMFQDTKIVITILLLFVRLPRICQLYAYVFRGEMLLYWTSQLIIREQEQISPR